MVRRNSQRDVNTFNLMSQAHGIEDQARYLVETTGVSYLYALEMLSGNAHFSRSQKNRIADDIGFIW